MKGKIRKSLLCISFLAAIFINLVLIETGKFESIAGITIWIINLAYMALFTAANIKGGGNHGN